MMALRVQGNPRDGFGELIAAIQVGAVDVVIVRDMDGLTPAPDRLERLREGVCAARRAAVGLYGGDLDLSTAEGAY